MQAIILAAGYATRLMEVTRGRPKALLPIAGKPIITRLLEEICTMPVSKVHVVTNHRYVEAFHAWQASLSPDMSTMVNILDDNTTDNDNRLGAIGDIQFTLQQTGIQDDIFIAAADNLFSFPLRDFYDAYAQNPRNLIAATEIADMKLLQRMAVATLEPTLQGDKVIHMIEKPLEPQSQTGVFALYIYPASTLPFIQQYLDEGNSSDAPGYFPSWLYQRQDVYAYRFTGRCFDIGTPDSYREAEEWWKAHRM